MIMNRTILTAGAIGLFLSFLSLHPATAADDTGWRLKLGGVAAKPLLGDGDLAFGGGVGLEYRASRRLGVELSASTAEIEEEFTFGFFDDSVTIGTALRMTPVLAKLNVHLTPDSRADLYLGPVAGRVMYGDFDVTVHSSFDGETVRGSVKTEDDWAWGAHIGVDVPVGDRGLFFNAGITWLKAEVEIEDPEEGGTFTSDLDPVIAQVGFGYRF
jgi:outer membrane protein W